MKTEYEKKTEIIHRANGRDCLTLTVNGKKYPAQIAGARLDFPYIWARHEDGHTIDAQINWKQAERLANGEQDNINY